MKLKRNGLIGFIKDKLSNWICNNEEILLSNGIIYNFMTKLKKTEPNVDDQLNVSVHLINVFTSLDYEYLLDLVDNGFTVFANHSNMIDPYKSTFFMELGKELIKRGLHYNHVSSSVIVLSPKDVDIIDIEKQKEGLAKIYKFPNRYNY